MKRRTRPGLAKQLIRGIEASAEAGAELLEAIAAADPCLAVHYRACAASLRHVAGDLRELRADSVLVAPKRTLPARRREPARLSVAPVDRATNVLERLRELGLDRG